MFCEGPCYPVLCVTHSSEPSDRADPEDGASAGARLGDQGADGPPAAQARAARAGTDTPAVRLLLVVLRYAAPACAAIALLIVMAADGVDLDEDIHVFVPSELDFRATQLPVRALRYDKLLSVEGPVLVQEPLAVKVVTARDTRTGHLQPAAGGNLDLEADLPLPALTAGDWVELVTYTERATPKLEVRSHIRVRDRLEVVMPRGRAARGLQQFSPGPIQAEPDATAPDGLAVRVRGGACVPELSCTLAVRVGSPAASLHVQPNTTVTPSPAAQRGSLETSGTVVLTLTTHGPEAELWLVADRAGTRVARRAVRLPVALGGFDVEGVPLVVNRSADLRLRGAGIEGGCIVDAFQAGHWRGTGSIRDCATPSGLPFALGPGLWRLQLRRDALSSETAAVAAVYVRKPQESPQQVAAAWAGAAVAQDPDDWLARKCMAEPGLCEDEAALEYLAAIVETGLLPLPEAATGYAARLEQARQQNARMRWMALLALCLGAVGLVLSVGRTGVSAGVRASQLLSEDPGAARRAHRRGLLLSAASALSLLLVFAVLALYVLARGRY